MKYVISFSGGEGSFCAAVRMKGLIDPEDITLVFCDTKIEHPDLYRFLDKSAKAIKLPLVKLADGRNPWEVFATSSIKETHALHNAVAFSKEK